MRSVRIFAAGFTLTALSSLLQPALSQDPIKIGVMFPSGARRDHASFRRRKEYDCGAQDRVAA